jgi:hypothetical protein
LRASAASRIVRAGMVKVHAVIAEYHHENRKTLDDHLSAIVLALILGRQ